MATISYRDTVNMCDTKTVNN